MVDSSILVKYEGKKYLQHADNNRQYYIQRCSLDMIISVGYTVHSQAATKFLRDIPKAPSLEIVKAKHRALLRGQKPLTENPDQETFSI